MNKAASCLALVLLGGAFSHAAQQLVPTQRLFIRNPDPGGDPTKRRMFFKSKNGPGSTNAVVGAPNVSGATLHVKLASGAEQCFDLPAAGWSSIGPLGYLYMDFDGPGAVTNFSFKRGPSGVFAIKMHLSGRPGALDVVPAQGETGFDMNFALGDGDAYCAGGSTPADGTSTDKVYKVKNVPAPASCGVAACLPSP